MKKTKGLKFLAASLAMMLVAAFAMPAAVFAELLGEGGGNLPERETKYFNVDIVVHENNSYDFTETVGTIFNTKGHGIYRYVPETWDDISETVGEGWCSTDEVETYSEDGNYVIQMGSGDKWISGDHEFKYGYNITMRDDRDTTRDILYIDLLPTNWQTPIGSTEITIHLPKPIDKDSIEMYSGNWKSEILSPRVNWEYDGKKTIKVSAEDLRLREGITMLATLPEGYWVDQYDPTGCKTGAVVMSILMVLAFVLLWFRFGKRQTVVETVEFHPPKGITPAEIGLMIDGSLDKKDMVSMFMYFAQRGYLTIKGLEKKKFQFTKVKDIDKENEKKFATILFNGIFHDNKDVVNSGRMGKTFGKQYMAAHSCLEDSFGDVMLASSKRVQRFEGIWLYIAAITLLFMGEVYTLRGVGMGIGAGACLIIAAFFAGKLRKSYRNRRSGKKSGKKIVRCIYWIIDGVMLFIAGICLGGCFESGAIGMLCVVCFAVCEAFSVYYDKLSDKAYKYMGKVLGLRNFIETAELDRLNALVAENPSYYFDILPYAYVLGLTNKWAKKFESIKIEIPEWFEVEPIGAYIPALYMEDALNEMTSGIGTAVRRAVDLAGGDTGGGFSDGGGFSGGGSGGGGFSGGGAGGGGGGFW